MYLLVRSPTQVIWEGEVATVESENQEGVFTIYPDHANFMTPLQDTDLIASAVDGTEHAFALIDAVLHLHDNVVKVYVHDAREATTAAEAE